MLFDLTVFEMFEAFTDAREDSSVGVVCSRSWSHSDGKYAALVVTNPFESGWLVVEMVFQD